MHTHTCSREHAHTHTVAHTDAQNIAIFSMVVQEILLKEKGREVTACVDRYSAYLLFNLTSIVSFHPNTVHVKYLFPLLQRNYSSFSF